MEPRRRLMIEGPDGLFWHNAHGWVPSVIAETFAPADQGKLRFMPLFMVRDLCKAVPISDLS